MSEHSNNSSHEVLRSFLAKVSSDPQQTAGADASAQESVGAAAEPETDPRAPAAHESVDTERVPEADVHHETVQEMSAAEHEEQPKAEADDEMVPVEPEEKRTGLSKLIGAFQALRERNAQQRKEPDAEQPDEDAEVYEEFDGEADEFTEEDEERPTKKQKKKVKIGKVEVSYTELGILGFVLVFALVGKLSDKGKPQQQVQGAPEATPGMPESQVQASAAPVVPDTAVRPQQGAELPAQVASPDVGSALAQRAKAEDGWEIQEAPPELTIEDFSPGPTVPEVEKPSASAPVIPVAQSEMAGPSPAAPETEKSTPVQDRRIPSELVAPPLMEDTSFPEADDPVTSSIAALALKDVKTVLEQQTEQIEQIKTTLGQLNTRVNQQQTTFTKAVVELSNSTKAKQAVLEKPKVPEKPELQDIIIGHAEHCQTCAPYAAFYHEGREWQVGTGDTFKEFRVTLSADRLILRAEDTQFSYYASY